MQENTKIASAASSRKVAKIFYYGNMAAVLIPFPIFILWFGASMFVYAMFRHHPNARVGYYTQIAAYHYYGLAGLLVPVLTFAPGDFFINYWMHLWGVCAIVLLPLSIIQILKVNREQWEDVEIKE
uniref:Uncharacterized protein n=1 Tax=uncultured Thiotrichaceae bacterium TaxID=298394 RepID=A0A6S6UCB4_9GAMM|nr:MAG: Unknown protein [uncultured Thiotrichaceae bacterium]